jgi:RimJ/RimL family protein N-acetyltransferase
MQVNIRPLEVSDAYTSVKWRNIAELWVHTTFKSSKEITIDDELQWATNAINDPTSERFAILADNMYVGNVYLTGISNCTAEYHIFIGEKSHWGKGVARAASVQIISYAKEVLHLEKVKLGVKSDNLGAFHLYKSLGFIETGEDEGGFIIMELLLSEWQGDLRNVTN